MDKGRYKVEVMSLIVALKVKYPERITMIRGGDRGPWDFYGLAQECERKYGNLSVWKAFMEMSQYLPLSAIIEGQVYFPLLQKIILS